MNYASIMFLFALLLALASMAQACGEAIYISRKASVLKINPALALAIVEVESGCDHSRVGSIGERGLFQLRPEFHGIHEEKHKHIDKALEYLVYLKKRCYPKFQNEWFLCYNIGPFRAGVTEPKNHTYVRRVRAEMAKQDSKSRKRTRS